MEAGFLLFSKYNLNWILPRHFHTMPIILFTFWARIRHYCCKYTVGINLYYFIVLCNLHIWIHQRNSLDLVENHFNSQLYSETDNGHMGAVMSMVVHLAPFFTLLSSSIWAHLARVLIYANTQALLVFSHEPPTEYESPLNHKIFFCK